MEKAMSVREAALSEFESIDVDKSAGRICLCCECSVSSGSTYSGKRRNYK